MTLFDSQNDVTFAGVLVRYADDNDAPHPTGKRHKLYYWPGGLFPVCDGVYDVDGRRFDENCWRGSAKKLTEVLAAPLSKLFPDTPEPDRIAYFAWTFWALEDGSQELRQRGAERAVLCELDFSACQEIKAGRPQFFARRLEAFEAREGESPEESAERGFRKEYDAANVRIARIIGTYDPRVRDIAQTLEYAAAERGETPAKRAA
ncbi:MAG: hypothetical protein K6F46_11255 [Desulfovibrio sp.]|nr:hypothetical protein [Desulfovibrio sp.]